VPEVPPPKKLLSVPAQIRKGSKVASIKPEMSLTQTMPPNLAFPKTTCPLIQPGNPQTREIDNE
jgi:hypothetical protein